MRLAATAAATLAFLAACSEDLPNIDPDAPIEEGPDVPPEVEPVRRPPTLKTIADPMSLVPVLTEHVGRMTGTTLSPFPQGMKGTDLGVSFQRDDELLFLFGDTMSDHAWLKDVDTVARAPLAMPARGLPKLEWFTDAAGEPEILKAPGLALRTMNVPVEGLAVGDATYVFFSSRWDKTAARHASSTLLRTTGVDWKNLAVVHDVASEHFINVSIVTEGDLAYVFGTGKYRLSQVYFARVPIASLGDRASWRYRDANGAWQANEMSAAPIETTLPWAGELSVRKHPSSNAYFMAYNCFEPYGIVMHVATSPEGPWSAAMHVYEDEGYGKWVHRDELSAEHDDGLGNPNDEHTRGDVYGPYFVPTWFTESGDSVGLTFVASSWNPYQVHLLRTWMAKPGGLEPAPSSIDDVIFRPRNRVALTNGDFANGFDGWEVTGDAFTRMQGSDGVWRVSSTDAAVGSLVQSFRVDATTTELTFYVSGGDGRVNLYHGADLVRSSRGKRSDTDERFVQWNLEAYRGQTLRLEISDTLTTPWGRVTARSFTLR